MVTIFLDINMLKRYVYVQNTRKVLLLASQQQRSDAGQAENARIRVTKGRRHQISSAS